MKNVPNDILVNFNTHIKKLFSDVENLQVRHYEYNILDVFRTMVHSSFKNNYYSDFTSNHKLECISSGNFSYWTVKFVI